LGDYELKLIAQDKNLNKRRIGFKVTGKGVARQGMKILDENQKEIGTVTSGTFTQANGSVGMGYVGKKFTKTGTKIFVDVRGKPVEAVIQKPPFVEPGYYRGA